MRAKSQSSTAIPKQPLALVGVGEPESSEAFSQVEGAVTDTQNENAQTSELLDWLRNMPLSPELQLEHGLGYKTKGKTKDRIHEAEHKALVMKARNVKEKKKTQAVSGIPSYSQNSEWLNELPVNLANRNVVDWLQDISKGSAVVHRSKPLSQDLSLHEQLARSSSSVNDLAVTHHNQSVITESGSKLSVWDVGSGQILHTQTYHTDKICAVDASKGSSSYVNYYHQCGQIFFSGHANGNLFLWGTKTGWLIKAIAAHPNSITSICLSSCGRMLLTSGRDNVHKLYDIRTFKACNEFKAKRNLLPSRQSRSCLSPDDNCIAAGYADGSIHVWSRLKEEREERVAILKATLLPFSHVHGAHWVCLLLPLMRMERCAFGLDDSIVLDF
ncbi:WD repeat-containing protein 46 [Asimina triloba]